jgi:GTP cyclohydrolase I
MNPDDVMKQVHPGWPSTPAVEVLHNGTTFRSADYVPVREDENEAVVSEMRELLQHITGVNFDREHMERTPERFVQMLKDLTTPEEFDFTVFPNENGIDEMISLMHIPFYTLCAHHIVPFYGFAHVGYVPGGSIAGLSKFARAVQQLAKKLTVQEELTMEIADFLEDKLGPQGVIVVLEAEHLCMAMRGVQTAGVKTRTTAVRGVFADHSRTAKAEFMSALNGG